MSNREFGVVFVRFGKVSGKAYMFEAPTYNGIQEGDTVIVHNSEGEEVPGIVVGVDYINTRYKEDDYKRYLAITGATEPLKRIIAKIVRKDMEYEEEEEKKDDEE